MSEAVTPGRRLLPGQRCEIWVADASTGAVEVVHETTEVLLEAPNWSPDGSALLVNGDGLLWRLDLSTSALSPVELTGLPPINNDHVVDAPRGLVYLSAADGHIYRAPLGGGAAVRVSSDPGVHHFLHGVSPDGADLAFVEIPRDWSQPGRLAVLPSAGGPTRHPEAGHGHIDGPEYSPDGEWIYLNTEHWASQPGHAQLARVPAGGGEPEQLVASDLVDWFPHLSPDGRLASYISFPTGTLGHPENLDVEVRLVRTDDWEVVVHSWPVFGGQGTLNVNSWAPDSTRFAFAAYPLT
ncbi:MAG: biopolymer transporter Tol [Propionibacteriaceae bacterium]|nr:biopolymer transporter Tol [Propionibacteriaceae bacterium]